MKLPQPLQSGTFCINGFLGAWRQTESGVFPVVFEVMAVDLRFGAACLTGTLPLTILTQGQCGVYAGIVVMKHVVVSLNWERILN